MGTVRFSTGRDTTPQEIDEVIKVAAQAIKKLTPGRILVYA